jgi:hypothetical protein
MEAIIPEVWLLKKKGVIRKSIWNCSRILFFILLFSYNFHERIYIGFMYTMKMIWKIMQSCDNHLIQSMEQNIFIISHASHRSALQWNHCSNFYHYSLSPFVMYIRNVLLFIVE